MTSRPSSVVVFDAFGTLFDPRALVPALEARFPGEGERLSASWRATQLRYTWLRSLMGAFEPFDRVTRDALAYTLRAAGHEPPDSLLDELAGGFSRLLPYPEAGHVLERLRATGASLAILSNGTEAMLGELIRRAGWDAWFEAILSVDRVGVYKPDPRVYGLVRARLGTEPAETRFVSGNAWDCAGGRRFGFDVVWIRRHAGPFDELGISPDRQGTDLTVLLD